MKTLLVPLVATLLASAATAAPPPLEWLTSDVGDPYGAASIQQGRYDAAEKRLAQAYVRGQRAPELLLNLAALHARAGRGNAAQGLYREVLDQPNISLVTLSGTRWSHDVAQTGLGSDSNQR